MSTRLKLSEDELDYFSEDGGTVERPLQKKQEAVAASEDQHAMMEREKVRVGDLAPPDHEVQQQILKELQRISGMMERYLVGQSK